MNWLGQAAIPALPTVSVSFSLFCNPTEWLVFNILDVCGLIFCEWMIMKNWRV